MPDGSVILVEMFGPRLTRVLPDGTKETIAESGGPNGAAIGPDGALYLCNNGGCFTPVELGEHAAAGSRSTRRATSVVGSERVDLATRRRSTDLYTECDGHPLRAPERPRVRQRRRVLVHRPRHPRPCGADQRPDQHLLRQGRRLATISEQVVIRPKRRTASVCRPTGRRCTGPRLTPVVSSGDRSISRRTSIAVRRRSIPPVCLRRAARLSAARLVGRRRRRQRLRRARGQRWHHRRSRADGDLDRALPHRRPADDQHLLRRDGRQCGEYRDRLHHAVGHREAVAHALARIAACASTTSGWTRQRRSSGVGSLVGRGDSASTSRRSAARRTRSTPTSWSARCWPTGWRRPTTLTLADLVVVNTCAFIEDARQESIDTILALDEQRKDGARLVVTGCMAERYGDELAEALPEVDLVAGFGVPRRRLGRTAKRKLIPVASAPTARRSTCSTCPGRESAAPWAYVKIAEGCDRIVRVLRHPVVPGPQRSRDVASILAEVDAARGARDRARRPGPGVATARTGPASSAPARSCRSCRRSRASRRLDPAAVPLPDRPHRRADRRDLRHRRAVLRPVAAARQQAAAAPHAALGRRRPVPAPHRRHPRAASPTPRSAPTSSSATRARPRTTTTSCCASSKRRSSTGAASSPTAPRTARTPWTSTARSTRALMDERLAELRELQDGITAAAVTN